MNEHVENFARHVEAAYIPRYDMWQMDSETMQKFAELIAKECADISDASFHNGSAGYLAILNHFGVNG